MGGERRMRADFRLREETHTLGDFRTLHGFIVDGAGALLDEFIALNAEVDHFDTLDAKLNELFRDLMDDVCSGLKVVSTFFFHPKVGACMTLYLVRSASADKAGFLSSTAAGAGAFSVSDIPSWVLGVKGVKVVILDRTTLVTIYGFYLIISDRVRLQRTNLATMPYL